MNLDKLLGGVPDGVVDIIKDLIDLNVASVKLSELTKPEEEKRDMAREIFGEYSSDAIVSDLFGVVSQFF